MRRVWGGHSGLQKNISSIGNLESENVSEVSGNRSFRGGLKLEGRGGFLYAQILESRYSF
ncbi:hypothetical protein DQM68_05390 [Leptospira mayottensis]|uniref:Uncharacterized protein n=2 Tax=Leptospira mayottensis TaxID=1137606 RepID=A0AA87MRC0_9LEPT|nr:hypothetical protein DQM68_05390 [Leptospira mayottensis]AXR66015.1 hypothetical protein DQM28_04085 [Leptospira mayottensis]AZQ03904.1 hypothetical protein LEP1GSC190_16355 [Leptospira mayottensis 200901116]EKS01993.1 hypothetical protein LEP1GSC125_0274 [Leptospira mayottensis 200901122]TGN14431.1 hypothetical protein EHR03_03685 [Leptospira mayottensis]